jgi:hypothetical protein
VSPDYRCGEFGAWSLRLKSAVTTEPGYFTGWGDEPRGHYIERGGRIWMSTSRLERESHAVHVEHARGTVVVCGVGMGMYLHNIAARPEVQRIIAVDRDPAVFDLVRRGSGFDAWDGRDKVAFVEKDALRLTPEDLCGARADYLYVDIWPELGDPRSVSDTRAIQAVVGARTVGWWGQELDFMEWAFRRRSPHGPLTVNDLREFSAACGLPIDECSVAYVDGCRRAADVFGEYGPASFAAALRTWRLTPPDASPA